MARAALTALGTSIFSDMTQLAVQHGAINLAQGFPDFDGPASAVQAAIDALSCGNNQYGRSMGVVPLVEQIAAHQQRHYGLSYDPMREVCATAGCTEAIAASIFGLFEPGDEVIVFEPCYDSYLAALAMAGVVPRVVTLRFPDFALPVEALRAEFCDKTRGVLLNTPHNPTGKVFSHAELAEIARLCVAHDVIAITDEVYEHLIYDDAVHVPLATLPRMRDRTVTLSSTGKTFSLTGWKVGWATGPAELIAGVQRAHQYLTFCAATPLHTAMAQVLASCDADYLTQLRHSYTERRDFLVAALTDVGFVVSVPRGAYFVLASGAQLTADDDVSFARQLVMDAGVAAIPPSAFYPSDRSQGRSLLRFAFCKRLETLELAAQRLRTWRRQHPTP